MAHQTQQAPAGEADKEVRVEFSNFHQVLEYFDDQGQVKDKEHTRFSIPCGICKLLDLPLFNEEHESFSPEKHHEFYTILKCGHAYGSRCILVWLRGQFTCPLCRTPPFRTIRGSEVLSLFGDVRRPQSEEIREIRKFLNPPVAEPSTTNSGDQGPPPSDNADPMLRAFTRIQQAFNMFDEIIDERAQDHEELMARQGRQR